MDKFDFERKGDLITMRFSQFIEGGKAEYSLVGEKHDIYRMAMGVGMSETLSKMVSGDNRLTPANAEADSDNVTLSINYGGVDTVKAPEPPPPATRDEQISRAYAQALESNDPAKLLAFASSYPDNPKALMARKLAERLASDQDYRALGPNATVAQLKEFAAKYPSSKYAIEARQRIDEYDRMIAERTAREEAERQKQAALAEAEKQRKAEEEKVRKEKVESDKKAADAAKKERDAYSRAKGSADDLKEFLEQHPESQYAAEAKAQVARIEKEKAEEEKSLGGKQRILAAYSPKAPALDNPADPAWNGAAATVIELDPQTRRAQKNSLEAKALVSGGKLYMRLKWRDGSQNRQYRPWTWDNARRSYSQTEELDDAIAVAIYTEANVEDSCMLHGQTHRTDLWLWRSFWSEISGKASDQMMVTSAERLPKSNPYASKSGKGQVWVQNLPDKGKPAWRYEIPLPSGTPQATMPSYVKDNATGSASDVDAVARHRDNSWTVTFSRVLDTGNEDDVIIPRTGRILVSFAAFDKADREDHASSQLVILEIQGR